MAGGERGFGTGFIETEALLYAQEDADADSGNIDTTAAYIAANFLPGEVKRLEAAADVLSEACRIVRHANLKLASGGSA